MSHNSDLPPHWKLSLRRAFNARANALCGFSSEAGPAVRQRLQEALEWYERRSDRYPSGDQLADFLEQVRFEHLFSEQAAEACVAAVMAKVAKVNEALADMDARDRVLQLAQGVGAALRQEEQGGARLAWTPGRRRVSQRVGRRMRRAAVDRRRLHVAAAGSHERQDDTPGAATPCTGEPLKGGFPRACPPPPMGVGLVKRLLAEMPAVGGCSD